MDTLEEKKYIYDMMRDITSERRELTKIYYELKSRLDDLILLETKGLDKTSVKGIVDLHNSRELQQIATNIEREAMGVIRKTEAEGVLNTSPDSYVDISNEVVSPSAENDHQKEEVKKLQADSYVEEEPKKVRLYNRSGTASLDKVASIIAHTLKEHGAPMKSKDLYGIVNDRLDTPIKRANFSNNMLPRASKLNPKINNVSHGYWQYLYK